MRPRVSAAWAAIGLLCAVAANSGVRAQSADEEVVKQTTRQISDSIARRVSASAVAAIEDQALNAWATLSYNTLEVDAGGGGDSDSDIYQGVFGVDRKFGSFYFGLAGAYSYSETDGGGGAVGSDVDADSYTIAPYAGYSFSKNFFAVLLAGYSISESDGGAATGDTDVDTFFTDLSLNSVHVVEQYILKAKAGWRYSDSDADVDVVAPGGMAGGFAAGGDSESHILYLGGEVGYRIGAWTPYARAVFEYFEPEDEPAGSDVDHTSAFVTLGFTHDVTQAVTLGAGLMTQLGADDVDNHQVFVEGRIKF
jgi:hypothetical protein